MKPFLLKAPVLGFNLSLPTYGLILAAAFVAALWCALRSAKRAGLPRDAILDVWIAALISGIVGAKILLYLVNLERYVADPWSLITDLRSAGVFYGGLVAAVGTCAWLVARRGLPGWKVADAAAPAVALGQAVGRLGCLAAGCCYGKPTSLPWAVTFTDPDAGRLTGVPLHTPLHPAQIYHMGADFLLFVFLLWLERRKRYDGQVFLWYLLLYAAQRALVEFVRGDPRGELAGISTSQYIAAVAAAAAAGWMLRRRGARRQAQPAR